MPQDSKKWHTKHQWGAKKRKKKKQCSKPPTAASSSRSSNPVPDSSSDLPAIASASTESASAKKLRRFRRSTSRESGASPGHPEDVNFIISLKSLNELFSAFECESCEQPYCVTEDETARMGSACKLTVRCTACGTTVSQCMTSAKSGTVQKGFDINRRLSVAATSTGVGFTQLRRFFSLMNMPPPMHLKTWQKYRKAVHSGARQAADKHLQEAAEEVRQLYDELNLVEPNPDGRLDISVSFDGSWHKRGRTSHSGIATVIEIYSGLVVDYVSVSNYCHGCEVGPKPGSAGYQDWEQQHEGECQKTVKCSSQAMESEAALILWQRSEALHNFRYMEMLGDGDGKAHTKINEAKVYGEGVQVKKIDCVNHVTKRMGTALRTLVEKRKAQKAPIGGRGNLTDARITKLTNYYGRAIKDHPGDLEGMVNAVWASYFHTLSSDEDPRHNRCPASTPDKPSWCFYKRAQEANETPNPHPHPLPRDIAEALVPVYKRLGDPQLLQRCVDGKTQNSNESFHSLVWSMCPKQRWAGRRSVDTAVAIAVPKFNKGSSAHLDVMEELELLAGVLAVQNVQREDEERLKSASRKSSQQARRKRKRMDDTRRAENQTLQREEGVLYSPGLD